MSFPPPRADETTGRRHRRILGPTILAMVGVLGLLALHAAAAPIHLGTLTSTDAGQSNRLALIGNQTYELVCYGATGCWQIGDATVTTDCSKDQPYPVVNNTGGTTPTSARELPIRIAAPSGSPWIAARAWDAGNPDCQVHRMVGGAVARGGALPLGPITPR